MLAASLLDVTPKNIGHSYKYLLVFFIKRGNINILLFIATDSASSKKKIISVIAINR